MVETKLIVEDLMQLYEDSPNLVLYKNDLVKVKQRQYIEEIARMSEDENLNPIDVVLESLINVLSEKLSIDTLTCSMTTAYMDKSIQELATQKVINLVKNDVSFLKEIHKEWLERLRIFLSNLKEMEVQTLQEAIFQVSLKFRISAPSSMKAITSLIQSR